MTTVFKLPGRKHHFFFYTTGPGNSAVVESCTVGYDAFLETLHFILSGSMASDEPLTVRVSSGLAAAYGNTLLSYSIQDESNYFWQPSRGVFLASGDAMIFSVIVSAAGTWAIMATGWAIVEESIAIQP